MLIGEETDLEGAALQLLNCLDGFDYLGRTKVIFATNRVSVIGSACVRSLTSV